MKKLNKLLESTFNDSQKELVAKHGTPFEFAIACFQACPEISYDEAEAAAQKYRKEFSLAGHKHHYMGFKGEAKVCIFCGKSQKEKLIGAVGAAITK